MVLLSLPLQEINLSNLIGKLEELFDHRTSIGAIKMWRLLYVFGIPRICKFWTDISSISKLPGLQVMQELPLTAHLCQP